MTIFILKMLSAVLHNHLPWAVRKKLKGKSKKFKGKSLIHLFIFWQPNPIHNS